MAFRKKTKTRDTVVQKETIDSLHKKMKINFQQLQSEDDVLYKRLAEINIKIQDIRAKPEYNSLIPDLRLQNEVWKLEQEIDDINVILKSITSRVDEKNYLIKTGKLLNKYYKLLGKEKEIIEMTSKMDFKHDIVLLLDESLVSNTDTGIAGMKKKDKKDIMDWFNDVPKTKSIAVNLDTMQPVLNLKLKKNQDPLSIPIEKKPVVDELPDKQKLYDKYMKIIDPNYVSFYDDEFELFDICFHCHNEMILNHNTGMLNCNNCGMTERIIVDSDKQSHKEPPKEMTSFSYKRINHLNEILSQFQAKETTEIPDEVYDKILLELKKERIENMALLNKEKLREILKKIDETDYYEHIPYIINQLNGLPPPVISPEVEEIIRGLFLQLQHPFNTNCPDDRKNFLTYGYTLYKIFELLELDDYLCNFKFLKDRKKLYEQEQIWKAICKELKWEFIPSI